eukprot:g10916.t1
MLLRASASSVQPPSESQGVVHKTWPDVLARAGELQANAAVGSATAAVCSEVRADTKSTVACAPGQALTANVSLLEGSADPSRGSSKSTALQAPADGAVHGVPYIDLSAEDAAAEDAAREAHLAKISANMMKPGELEELVNAVEQTHLQSQGAWDSAAAQARPATTAAAPAHAQIAVTTTGAATDNVGAEQSTAQDASMVVDQENVDPGGIWGPNFSGHPLGMTVTDSQKEYKIMTAAHKAAMPQLATPLNAFDPPLASIPEDEVRLLGVPYGSLAEAGAALRARVEAEKAELEAKLLQDTSGVVAMPPPTAAPGPAVAAAPASKSGKEAFGAAPTTSADPDAPLGGAPVQLVAQGSSTTGAAAAVLPSQAGDHAFRPPIDPSSSLTAADLKELDDLLGDSAGGETNSLNVDQMLPKVEVAKDGREFIWAADKNGKSYRKFIKKVKVEPKASQPPQEELLLDDAQALLLQEALESGEFQDGAESARASFGGATGSRASGAGRASASNKRKAKTTTKMGSKKAKQD